jgi:hypothetical protein
LGEEQACVAEIIVKETSSTDTSMSVTQENEFMEPNIELDESNSKSLFKRIVHFFSNWF